MYKCFTLHGMLLCIFYINLFAYAYVYIYLNAFKCTYYMESVSVYVLQNMKCCAALLVINAADEPVQTGFWTLQRSSHGVSESQCL